jgi:putative transposase
VESAQGKHLGAATLLDPVANNRRRRRSTPATGSGPATSSSLNLVELTLQRREQRLSSPDPEVA